MAKLFDVVTSGISLSHGFSEEHVGNIYIPITSPWNIKQISIPDLGKIVIDFVKRNSNITQIEMYEDADFPNNTVNGILERKGSVVYIYINEKMNDCWKRFTYCKELLQLYIDFNEEYALEGDDYLPVDIAQQINDLLAAQLQLLPNDPSLVHQASWVPFTDKVATELTAITMAIDLIFALEDKSLIVQKLFNQVDNNKIKVYDIAHAYKMPEYIVKTYQNNFHKLSLEMAEGRRKALLSKTIPSDL